MSVVAVLVTCHNRRTQTLACLERLFDQALPQDAALKVYLVDDGSTDGTANAVRQRYPSVSIIPADGSLFWCNGMRLAWENAAKESPEFYLWLNDDTLLRAGTVVTLIRVAQDVGNPACIVVGSCCDANSGARTYGGQRLLGKHPAKVSPIEPDAQTVKACDTFNGNCVLVTRAAYHVLGILRDFQHATADTDYGLRACRSGVPVLLAPGFLAECSANPVPLIWRNRELPRAERFRSLLGRKGLPPWDWWRFLWEHAGVRAFLYWPIPYLRVLSGL